MKNLYRILIALLAFSFIAVSCKDKEYEYIPGEPETSGCYGVFFPTQDASGSHTYDPSMERSVAITVSRTNSSGAITVPFTVTASEEGVFNFGTINFADGQTETELLVSFPNAKLGTEYSFSVQIDDKQYASIYNEGAAGLDFSVLIVEWIDVVNPVTKNPAVVTFNLGWWGTVVEAKLKYYEVDGVRTCETYDEKVIVGNSDAPTGSLGFWGGGADNHLHFTWFLNKVTEIDGEAYNAIDVPKQYLGFDYDDWLPKPIGQAGNPIFAYDWFHFLITDGGYPGGWPDWEGFLERNPGVYDRSYYDGNGGFMLNLRYYIPGLGGWTPDTFDTVGIVEGYTRVDYSLDIEVDYSSEGVLPVYFESGADVATIKIAAYEGELTATQAQNKINEIIEGATEGVITVNPADYSFDEKEAIYYGTVGLVFGKTGTFTVIALAYDEKGGFQGSDYTAGPYVIPGEIEDNAVDIHLATEQTPARYLQSGLDPYSSFAFYAYGKDVTEAHVGVYKTKSVAADPQTYLDAVKTNLDASGKDAGLGLPEDALAQLNATGGYFEVLTGLTDETSYTVIVWATNGVMDKFVTAEWTTEKFPEVFKTIGTGTWTDDLLAPLFELDPLTFNVTVMESEETPGKYKVVYPYGPDYPLNEPGMYDATASYDIIINASDPDYVYIPMQETGCNWGYGMMSICDDVGRYMANGYSVAVIRAAGIAGGTLKDGVITFPVKSMFVWDDDGGYYGNRNGAFKLVLPAAASATSVKLSAPYRPSSFTKSGSSAPKLSKKSFEREPQPVDMKVAKVGYDRKESVSSKSSISKPEKVRLF